MKKILLIVVAAVVLFSCKKSDTTATPVVHISASANFVKRMVIHITGTPGVDTATFIYDSLGRLSQYHEAGVDTTSPATTYYFDNFSFIYTTGGSLPTEYAYYDVNNIGRVHLLFYNSNGQLAVDSSIGNGYLQINNNNSISSIIFYSYGDAFLSDSLSFVAGNLDNWIADTVIDANVSPTVLSRAFITTYDSYSTNLNPLYNLYSLAPVLFKHGSLSANYLLDPSFLYSKYLPLTETDAGSAVTYDYSFNGTQLQQATETYAGTPFTFTFYY